MMESARRTWVGQLVLAAALCGAQLPACGGGPACQQDARTFSCASQFSDGAPVGCTGSYQSFSSTLTLDPVHGSWAFDAQGARAVGTMPTNICEYSVTGLLASGTSSEPFSGTWTVASDASAVDGTVTLGGLQPCGTQTCTSVTFTLRCNG